VPIADCQLPNADSLKQATSFSDQSAIGNQQLAMFTVWAGIN
jgi:hypothetical protein